MPQLFVRTLSGSTLAAEQEGTVAALKVELESRGCVAAEVARLSCNGHILEDDELLQELEEKCTLNLNVELLGGGKKRKKKTYTKPKKIKAKHKKVKLAVLKYYKVDQSSGKVTRLRKECPAECGAGTFMAMHFNRHYCGKCHLTYMLENPGRDPALDKKKEAPAAAAAAAAPAKGGKKKK
jgi:small subunit ribosomal protein S27Ae